MADVHNAREAAWATPRPASEVIARLDAGHARFVELLESLTPEERESVCLFIEFLKKKERSSPSPFLAAVNEFIDEHPELLRHLSK